MAADSGKCGAKNLARASNMACAGRMLFIAVGIALALVALDVLDVAKLA